MVNSMEDYKKISDSLESYSHIELDLIEKIDDEKTKRIKKAYKEIYRDEYWWMVVWGAVLDIWWRFNANWWYNIHEWFKLIKCTF